MKLKFAFTLAELMIFFVITATLLSLMFAAIKPQKALEDKNVKYKYATVYDALNLASYDLIVKDKTNPFLLNNTKDAYKSLCKGLADYINTENDNCNISPISQNVAYMKNANFDFRTLTPNLTALNGMKIYISELITDDKQPKNEKSYYDESNPDFTLKFFMVYVDLNGNDYPQRAHSIVPQPKKNHPDVFAFAVIPTGEAIPIGIAEYNVKYLATRISYHENGGIYYSPFYSLHQAKHAAWNWYSSGASNVEFKEKISFTYNDYSETYNTAIFSKCNPPTGTALTSYDLCSITVDTPNFGSTQ